MEESAVSLISVHVVEPVFGTDPLFIFGGSAWDLAAHLKRRFGVSYEPEGIPSGTMLTFDKSPWRVVWVEKLPATVEDLSSLVHEMFHLVTRICGDKGVPIHHHISTGECGDEAAAYLMGFFLAACLNKLKVKRIQMEAKRV
jgi:hypothetical protein